MKVEHLLTVIEWRGSQNPFYWIGLGKCSESVLLWPQSLPFDKIVHTLAVNGFLRRIQVIDIIKSKGLLFSNEDLRSIRADTSAYITSLDPFLWQLRSDSAVEADDSFNKVDRRKCKATRKKGTVSLSNYTTTVISRQQIPTSRQPWCCSPFLVFQVTSVGGECGCCWNGRWNGHSCCPAVTARRSQSLPES